MLNMKRKEEFKERFAETATERAGKLKRSLEALIHKPLALAAMIGYFCMAFLLVYYIFAFVYAFTWLDSRIFPTSPVFAFFVVIVNIALFPLATVYDELNFEYIKKILITINYSVVCFLLLSYLFHYTGIFLFLKIFSLKITPFVSVEMLISLARISEGYICGIPLYGMLRLWIGFLKNKDVMKELMFFRLSHYVDLRENKGYSYDLHLGRSIVDKQPLIVFEEDRYLHQFVDGVSGTGKTSLVMLGGIAEDLNTRLRNERMQKKMVKQMLKEGKIYRSAEADSFCICDFKAYPMYQEEFEEVKRTYRAAGQTIMAPDDDILDKVYKLAKARGVKVNRMDPTVLKSGRFKDDFIGFNPFYIPPKVAEKQDIFYAIAVDRKAAVYRDVMQQLYELRGKSGDPYFSLVNETTNYNMSILCILTYPFLMGRQANPVDCLHELVNLEPVTVKERSSYMDKSGMQKERTVNVLKPSPRLLELMSCYRSKCSILIQEHFDLSFAVFFESNFINNPASGVKLFEQSLGLRNLISAFITSPFIRPILTAPDDNTLSIPDMIERGEVTLFNFFQKMGKSYARVFGLFFLLNYDIEVTARPGTEKTRIPNFFRCDEFPIILHPVANNIISIWRKFRVPAELVVQSLAQMGETNETKFLANILMSCGTQLLFGRANLEEMDLYSKLAGMYKEDVEQYSYAEGSIWSETDDTQQVRATPTDTARASGDDLRYRNFAECTVFPTRQGVAMKPVVVRFTFLESFAFMNKLNWRDEFDLSVYEVFEDEVPEENASMFEEQGFVFTHEEIETGSVLKEEDLTREESEEPAAGIEKKEPAADAEGNSDENGTDAWAHNFDAFSSVAAGEDPAEEGGYL